MVYANLTAPSPSVENKPPDIDPGPVTGLVVLSFLGCAVAYRLRQLGERQTIHRIHTFGFVGCYLWVLAYSISDTMRAPPQPIYLQLLSVTAGIWFTGWIFAALVYHRLLRCVRGDYYDRDPEDRSTFDDDL